MKERELVASALKVGKDVLMALHSALRALEVEEAGEVSLEEGVHQALHGLYEAQEGMQVVLGLLRELEERFTVERLGRNPN
jgi:hypothetical protein